MRWPLWRVAVTECSMQPALQPGDWLLTWRGAHTLRIRPGQIVIARHPGDPAMLLVKRAVRQLPDGWWLESDNPVAEAVDSGSFGPVPFGLIHARVLLRYWPRRRS